MESRKKTKKERKKAICAELSAAVKKVQEEYVHTKQVERDSQPAERLCDVLEVVFLHELKNTKGILWREVRRSNAKNPPEPTFWVFIDPLVSDEMRLQLLALRNADSDVMKCRSWIRLMLSKSIMLTFLEDLQRHPGLLASHYGGEAVIRDTERFEVIIQLMKGISLFQFDCDYTSTRLEGWNKDVLRLACIWEPTEGGSGKMSPAQTKSPYRGSNSRRISPPASEFDLEGVGIIDLALDKYSRKKTKATITDSQLISKEALDQTPEHRIRHADSFSSLSSDHSTTLPDPEATAGSYGAMLQSYAQRNKSQGLVAAVRTEGYNPSNQFEVDNDEEYGRHGDGYDLNLALSLNYEIVAEDGSFIDSQKALEPQNSVMYEHLTKLVAEKGLDSQNYHCAGCKRPVGIIFGQAKLCKYNGQHYCFECHRDDERIIPARVLYNWDFRRHRVCIASCEFLDRIEHSLLLDVHEVNKALYMYIPEMEEARKLRLQCKHLQSFLCTCKEQEAAEQFKKRVQCSRIYKDIHKYSLHDLMDINSGSFNDRLRKAVKLGKKHVKQCPLCSQKGFICEVCKSDQVIYPFEIGDTYQCPKCSTLFHLSCKPSSKTSCPKCQRLERRRANSINHDL